MQNETPGTGEKAAQRQRDYTAFEIVLNTVREAFLSLHTSYFNEERWRWDTPVITFTWGDGTDINRNLNGLVLGNEQPTGVEIEANAWRDFAKGTGLNRYWQHFPAGRLDFGSMSNDNIATLVGKAYIEVSSWTLDSLEHHAIILRD
jgi:hypothetical protein